MKIYHLKTINAIFKFKCSTGDFEHQDSYYIGMTTTTLSRRLTMLLASDAPQNHMGTNHNSTLTRENLVNNTIIINSQSDYNMEAIIINETNPSINKEYTGTQSVLKLL